MVDHLTRVTVDLRSPRAEALAAALAALGFEVRREARRVVADSTEVEGQVLKAQLRGRGFEDREYQVFVEFVRQWGIL
jgi:hypothetical protein